MALKFITSRRPAEARCRSLSDGFTVIELLITVAIILTIAAIAIPNYLAAVEEAKVARAIGDIHAIGNGIIGYEATNRQYPATLAVIGFGENLDPWGQPYQYLDFTGVKGKGAMRKDRFLVPINTYFDLYSMGKDGKTVAPLTAPVSQDDIIWASDGAFVGLASDF
jgi:general secretion pathway protein G